jgi:hypothetical protein
MRQLHARTAAPRLLTTPVASTLHPPFSGSDGDLHFAFFISFVELSYERKPLDIEFSRA